MSEKASDLVNDCSSIAADDSSTNTSSRNDNKKDDNISGDDNKEVCKTLSFCSCLLRKKKISSSISSMYSIQCSYCDYVSCIYHRFHTCSQKTEAQKQYLTSTTNTISADKLQYRI